MTPSPARMLAERIEGLFDRGPLDSHRAELEALIQAEMDKADKFWRTYWQDNTKTEIIEDRIAQAKKEAYEQGKASVGQWVSFDWESRNKPMADKIRKEAYEDAAKIAEDHAIVKGAHVHKGFRYCVEELAERLREKASQ